MWWDEVGCGRMWWDEVGCGGMWWCLVWGLVGSGGVRCDLVRSGAI